MANTIKIKNSGTAANVPSAASLQFGELALNYADGKLYFKTGASTVDFLKSNITLGTDTSGNYMSNVSAGTGISVSHTPAEGSTATVSVDAAYPGFAPIGSVILWAGDTTSLPTGYILCNGAALSNATTYNALFNVIGYRYGGSAGTFNVPSLGGNAIPLGTITANADSSRQTQAATSNTTSSTGHTHTFGAGNSGNQSADHTHAQVAVNTGNQSAGHTHAQVAVNTGTESANHTHAQVAVNTGNVSADHAHNFSVNSGNDSNNHTHGYQKPASNPVAASTDGISASHYHGVSGGTGGITANHFHTTNAATTGNISANHSHTTNASTTGGTSVGHSHSTPAATVNATNADTAHSHTISGAYVVYLIRFA